MNQSTTVCVLRANASKHKLCKVVSIFLGKFLCTFINIRQVQIISWQLTVPMDDIKERVEPWGNIDSTLV